MVATQSVGDSYEILKSRLWNLQLESSAVNIDTSVIPREDTVTSPTKVEIITSERGRITQLSQRIKFKSAKQREEEYLARTIKSA